MAAQIQSPPNPVAFDTSYIAKQTEILSLKHESFTKDWTITLNGQPLFTIEGESMSLSHRMNVLDASGKRLYQIRRETFTLGPAIYYAELSEDGQRIWEIEFESHLFSGSGCTMKFKNAASGGQMDELHFKNNSFGSTGYVTYRGQQVAEVKKAGILSNHAFDITVSKGLDMSIVGVLMLCMADMVRAKNSSASATASAGASGC